MTRFLSLGIAGMLLIAVTFAATNTSLAGAGLYF
jgi:hypothetical protein